MAQENRKSSERYISHHEHHHKEDPKITFKDSWNDNNVDEREEAHLMAVGSQKAHWNHYPQTDYWNANITNNEVALQSSTTIELNTYHKKDIGEGKFPFKFW
ncbi:hypothetical protein Tco_1162321 [Tanacetum coccineum]